MNLALLLIAATTAYPTMDRAFVVNGALPFTDSYDEGFGQASLEASPQRVQFSAQVVAASGDRYEITLTRGTASFDLDVNGSSGLGSRMLPRSRAAVVVRGVATVTKNGQPLTDSARLYVAALVSGAHAHDGTYRVLSQSQPGQYELDVWADGLPYTSEPTGFVQFDFDNLQIERDGVPLSSASMPGEPTATSPLSAYGATTTLSAPSITGPPTPSTPQPLNAQPATPLTTTPQPANAQPATPLLTTPSVVLPVTPLPPTPSPVVR